MGKLASTAVESLLPPGQVMSSAVSLWLLLEAAEREGKVVPKGTALFRVDAPLVKLLAHRYGACEDHYKIDTLLFERAYGGLPVKQAYGKTKRLRLMREAGIKGDLLTKDGLLRSHARQKQEAITERDQGAREGREGERKTG